MAKYTDQQRILAVKSRLKKIMDGPRPDCPEPRKPGKISMELNGRKTEVDLLPIGSHVAQWSVTINGKKYQEPMGMTAVYKEIARLNPPARNFY
jgi:hypothetical protein